MANNPLLPATKGPLKHLCELFYKEWLAGRDPAPTLKKAGVTPAKYAAWQPYFLAHCREATRAQLKKNPDMRPDVVPLTPARRQEFLDYLVGGLGYDKIGLLMNVPIPTILDVWLADPVLKAEATHVIEACDARVVMSLYRCAVGAPERRVTRRHVEEDATDLRGKVILDDDGNKVTLEKREETVTTTSPKASVDAQKFWLTNRQPHRWKMQGDEGNTPDSEIKFTFEVV